MINRWYDEPRLRGASGDERPPGWLELTWDLVLVAVLVRLGAGLAAGADLGSLLAFAGAMVPLWLVWGDLTMLHSRFSTDDLLHRCLVFAQLVTLAGLGVAADAIIAGGLGPYLGAVAVMQGLSFALVLRAWLQVSEVRAHGKRGVAVHGAVALLWTVAAVTPGPWGALIAAVAVLVDVVGKLAPAIPELDERDPPDARHVSERFGQLTLFVLVGGFLGLLPGLQAGGAGGLAVGGLFAGLVFSLWWVYFDDVADASIRRTRMAAYTWMWAHLPLHVGLLALGLVASGVAGADLSAVLTADHRIALAGGLALVLGSVAAIDAVTRHRASDLGNAARVRLRLVGAALALGVGAAGGGLTALAFVALLTALGVVQVLADLALAPWIDPRADPSRSPMWEPGGPRQAPDVPRSAGSLRSLGRAVRKGVPSEFRRDLYLYLIEGSWVRMLGTLAVVWVLSNVFFGALYLLEPGSVSNVHDGSFLEAFSFSVQTMSSIGYGVMAPQTDYAHVLVAVEALVGLLGIAVATGLVFAKASRPSLSVLFSRTVVIHRRDGLPTLEFRVGNARGVEVVEATVHVTAVIEEVSSEGHEMRRLHDLVLHRRMTPMFALTWTVMHTLDDDSPLRGLSTDDVEGRLVALVCTLTGHDAAYGQTTHARYIYEPSDLLFDHDFVDVIDFLPDGRLEVDFSRFHETRPQQV